MLELPSWTLIGLGLLITALGLLPLLLLGELRALRARIEQSDAQVVRLGTQLAEQDTETALTTEQRMRIEKELDALRLRLDRLELGESSAQPYAQAALMAQRGAGAAELARQCGLSRGEAELLVRLHGVRAAS